MNHTTREAARAAGHRLYLDQRGCRHGHAPTLRYVSTGNCRECSKVRYRSTTARVMFDVPHDKVAQLHALAASIGLQPLHRIAPDLTPPPVTTRGHVVISAQQAELERQHRQQDAVFAIFQPPLMQHERNPILDAQQLEQYQRECAERIRNHGGIL